MNFRRRTNNGRQSEYNLIPTFFTQAFKAQSKTVFFSLTVLLVSCSLIKSPASFWTKFHKDLITKNYSNQGPWGGQREVHWKCQTENCFSTKDIIDFANRNDWKLEDSVFYSQDSLDRITNSYNEDDDYSLQILKEKVLAQWKNGDVKVLVFKTGWITIRPGGSEEIENNGFVAISSNKAEIKLYHKWGE